MTHHGDALLLSLGLRLFGTEPDRAEALLTEAAADGLPPDAVAEFRAAYRRTRAALVQTVEGAA